MLCFLLVFVFVFFVGVAQTVAQTPPVVSFSVEEMELGKLEMSSSADPGVKVMRCADYFVRSYDPNVKPHGYQVLAIAIDGKGDQLVNFLEEKWSVVLDGSKKIPTVQYYFPDGFAVAELSRVDKKTLHLYTQKLLVRLRISPPDYERAAKCLPPPVPVPVP